MPTYAAFLRAINLGAKRRFTGSDIVAAVESTGARDVATYGNTGNVRLDTELASTWEVEAALEEAFAADRGFEVPTIVLTLPELVAVARDVERLLAELGEPQTYYVTLLKEPPSAATLEEIGDLSLPGEQVRVLGRAAHLLLAKGLHESRAAGRPFDRLGVGTARSAKVVRTLADRWA